MRLSETQQKVYENAKHTLEIVKKYDTYEEFFDNSKSEQNTFTTACHCNFRYNSSEKYKAIDPEQWENMKKGFYEAKNNNIIIVFAKTETVKALENAGLIQIVEPAKYKGSAETIKVLKF